MKRIFLLALIAVVIVINIGIIAYAAEEDFPVILITNEING